MPTLSQRRSAWALLALWILAAVGTTLGAMGWPTDNRLERWVGQLPPDPGWELLRGRFGGDESLLVRADGFRAGDPGPEEWLLGLGDRLASLPGVLQVSDPLHLPGLPRPNGGAIPWEALGQRPAVAALDLVDPALPRVDLILAIDLGASTGQRAELARRLGDLAKEGRSRGLRLRSAGHPLVASSLDLEASRVERVFVPALVLVAAVGVAFLLRSIPLAALALLPAITVSSGARATLRLLGRDSDLILVAVGPLTFVVMLASTLHLVACFQDLHGRTGSRPDASRGALGAKAVASALAAVTTAGGFGVFLFSDLRSVAHLGLTVAISVLVGVGATLAFLPPVLAGLPLPRPPSPRREGSAGRWRRLALGARRRRGLVASLGLGMVPLGVLAGTHLRTETNALHYFPAGHPVREEFLALEREGCALSTVEVLARRSDGQPWGLEGLERLQLASRLSAVEDVRAVFGPELVLAETRSLGPAALLAGPAALVQAGRLDGSGTWARWTVRFPTLEDGAARALVEHLQEASRIEGVETRVAGSVPRMLDMHRTLLGTLLSSLSLTLLATTALFLLAVRTAWELAVAFLVNVVPVAAVLSAASALAFPLDGATVMVAAVVLGLAVDNTFHLLHAAGRPKGGPRQTLVAFDRVGTAAAVSSAALALGFACLAFSGFAPTARFGLLCALGSVAALAANLVLLPALWVSTREAA